LEEANMTLWRDIQRPVARHLAFDPDAPLDQPPGGLRKAVVKAARRIIATRARPISFRAFVSLAFDELCRYLPYSLPRWAVWRYPITWLKWVITNHRAQSHTQFAEWVVCAVRDSGLAEIRIVNEHVVFVPRTTTSDQRGQEQDPALPAI
jgi:hypothetical protein